MRHTSSHTKNRRSHHALKSATIVTDKESGNHRLPHRLDEATGMYRGIQIVTARVKKVKSKTAKKEKKSADTTPHASKHEKKESRGLLGRMSRGDAKSRSGLGAEG